MNIFKSSFILALFACTNVMAAPATDASIQELMEVTQARKMMDGVATQVEGQMGAAIQKSLKGKTPTAAQQQAIQAGLQQWLPDLIRVQSVNVEAQDATLNITVVYTLVSNQQQQTQQFIYGAPSA